jgi:hypothetical protein
MQLVKQDARIYCDGKKLALDRFDSVSSSDKVVKMNVSERYRRSGDRKDYFAQYRVENDDKLKEYKWNFGRRNKQKKKEYDYHYRLRHLSKKRDYFHDYCRQNEEKVRNYRVESKDGCINTSALRSLKSWKSPEEVRMFFEIVSRSLRISSYSDWYRIARSQIELFGGMIII